VFGLRICARMGRFCHFRTSFLIYLFFAVDVEVLRVWT